MAEVILPTQLQASMLTISGLAALVVSVTYSTIETDLGVYLAIMYSAIFFLLTTVMITAINTETNRRGSDHG